MKNMRAFASRPAAKRQSGFIQNFIIPGLILIGVVIAGIAMLSSGSSTNTDNEKASMLANAVVAQSLNITNAVQRAEADGAIGAAVTGVVDISNTGVLITGRYATGSMPTLPAEAGNDAWGYRKANFRMQSGAAEVGTTTNDDILFVPMDGALAEGVCLRINNKLYGTSTVTGTAPGTGDLTTAGSTVAGVTGGTAGATEGCIKDSGNTNAFTYYKVVNVK